MIPDGNLELYKEINRTGSGKNRGTNKRFFSSLLITFKDWLFKTKIITMYYKIYNIYRSKMGDNSTKDSKK